MANEMEMAGFTFNRERIGKILGEVERRKAAAKDFIGDTRKVRAVNAEGKLALGFEGGEQLYGFTRNGRNQLADKVGIPRAFFGRMEENYLHRPELARLVTHFLHSEPENRLFRTLDGNVRAMMTNSYRTLDNADFFFLAADEFRKVGAEIWDARLTDDSFRLYAVAPGISAEIHDDVRNGAHWRSDEGGQPDRHVAAVCLQNSETGCGALRVRPSTLRMICQNWNVWDQTLTKFHLGRAREEAGWLSDETQRLEDKVVWSKVRDIIKTAFNKERFEKVVAELQGAKSDSVPDPVKAVSAAVEFCGLPESSLDAIRAKFIGEKDFTRYGLVQAVTWQSHEAESDEERDAYDDAGAKVLATPLKAILA